MKKEVLQIPSGVRYITEWKEYSLKKYQFPHILNKQLTGCGFTEYCIRCDENVVLCSPRKILLENKEQQHESEVFYVRNTVKQETGFDEDITRDKSLKGDSDIEVTIEEKQEELEETREEVLSLKKQIRDYVMSCISQRKPCKLLVTYDSFRHVKETLIEMGILSDFFVIIDEFQSLLTDSRFKSSTEVEFINQLKEVQKLCYVSATPMMEKYLDMLDEFKDLPYYELDWITQEPERVSRPRLVVKPVKSVIGEVVKIINSYKTGNFSSYAWKNSEGKIIEVKSTEAVIYVNSVKNICDIIKKCKLTQENTNILCARTHKNEDKIRKAFGVTKEEFLGVGKVPKKGESHKMFTLCTRTVYLGADFYSTCARSFIFSDANINSMAVDITLDLPQILGRQRLDENPWRNSAELYFKTTDDLRKKTKEEFDKMVEAKLEKTRDLIDSFNDTSDPKRRKTLIEFIEIALKSSNYRKAYASIDHHKGKEAVVVFNKLVLVAEMRSFEIQQVDYKDRFSVFSSILNENVAIEDKETINSTNKSELNDALVRFNNYSTFMEKMNFICTDETFSKRTIKELLSIIPDEFEKYYYVLGPKRILSHSCKRVDLEQEYLVLLQNQGLDAIIRQEIYNRFEVGSRYANSFIKDLLSEIYMEHGYKKTAKATDLDLYFETKRSTVDDPDIIGKKNRAMELICRKFPEESIQTTLSSNP